MDPPREEGDARIVKLAYERQKNGRRHGDGDARWLLRLRTVAFAGKCPRRAARTDRNASVRLAARDVMAGRTEFFSACAACAVGYVPRPADGAGSFETDWRSFRRRPCDELNCLNVGSAKLFWQFGPEIFSVHRPGNWSDFDDI